MENGDEPILPPVARIVSEGLLNMKPYRQTLIFIALSAFGQTVETRGIQPESVVMARPQSKTPSPATAKPQYLAAAGATAGKTATTGRQVGVTMWRLRHAAANDSGARILVQEEGLSTEWVPERLASTSSLDAGDRVRLTIESPEAGYLYVIDRERYSDGQRGEPYLIFPTARTNNGDNHLAPGKLAEIPAQNDRPNFFTLRRSRANQISEELTVLLTPTPIPDLIPGASPTKLTNEQVAGWEKQWSGKTVQRFELAGGAGRPWTRAEQEAGASNSSATRLLTQDEAPPQTVYRAVGSSANDPVMVKVNLRYR